MKRAFWEPVVNYDHTVELDTDTGVPIAIFGGTKQIEELFKDDLQQLIDSGSITKQDADIIVKNKKDEKFLDDKPQKEKKEKK